MNTVTELGLLCDDSIEFKIGLVGTASLIGMAFGGVFLPLLDLYGRRKIQLYLSAVQVICQLILLVSVHLAKSYIMTVVVVFLSSTAGAARVAAVFALMQEQLSSPMIKKVAPLIFCVQDALNTVLVCLLFYMTGSSLLMYTFATVACAVLFIAGDYWALESP